jgi:putative flavoprotein involved in K+ transport
MITERIETVIVGGGQAGLAMSFHLGQRGREHIILERRRVAERWRSERWDSLTFQSPNWNIRLPGFAFQAPDLDAFAPRNDVVRFIEAYAAFIRAPLRCDVEATVLRHKQGSAHLIIETPAGLIEAKNVVIATGPYQVPANPLPIGTTVFEMHSSRYCNAESLPSGAVLVIGTGNSGCQIAEELSSAGRRVYLSVSNHRRTPRRYRSKDYIWWHLALGEADATIDQRRGALPSRLITGVGGGRDVNLRRLAADGVVLLGRILGGSDRKLSTAPDLAESLARGDVSFDAFTKSADEYAARAGLDLPLPDEPAEVLRDPRKLADPIPTLDLVDAGISTIIWANAFRYDFNWIDLPIFANGTEASKQVPLHKRGITRVPGVYFLGLPWLHKFKSSFLHGVGEDAEYLAAQIAGDVQP